MTRVGLKIGELSGVEPDSLRFCFEALVAGSDLDPLGLDVEYCPWTNRCRACGDAFRVVDYNLKCPACGSPDSEPAGGEELQVAYVELEEP